jgi:hypothetical protein
VDVKVGDLVVPEGGMDTILWDRPPLLHPEDTGETKKLSGGETGLVVETVGTGTDVCVRVLSSNGQVGWNWESMFILMSQARRGGG